MPNNYPGANLTIQAHNVARRVTVTGTDGEPPVYDETQLWKVWNMSEIYLGAAGKNKWIPKVNDLVEDMVTQKRYRVASIDSVTLVPQLEEYNVRATVDEMSKEEGRFFAGGFLISPCARQIFYDNSTAKRTLSIPSQFYLKGTTIHHAIAFKGTIVGNGGVPISVRYDENFNVIGSEIPLKPLQQRDPNNKSMWYIPDFYTTHHLEEGEMITIVIYDDRGGVRGRTNWIVEYSSLLRDVSDADKFVSNISLVSPYIDASDESNLLIPEQILKASINLMGKVHYSDGSTATYPIDGNKFELLYLERAMESVASTKGVLVLKYHLAENEKAVNTKFNDSEFFVTRTFNYTITERDGAYSVKLYPVPRWVNDTLGYQLDWYMFTLDRNQFRKVTNQVYITPNSPSRTLNGKLYNAVQQLNVAINLGTINNTFQNHIHPQTVDIRFMRSGGDTSGTRYLLGFDPYQNPLYGEGIVCLAKQVSGNNFALDLRCGCTTLEQWFEKVYDSTKPQYRTSRESEAPRPTMMKLLINGREYDFPIRKWNTELSVQESITDATTVAVVFYDSTQSNDLYYSVAPMPVQVI